MMKLVSETSEAGVDPAIAAWKAFRDLQVERERLLTEKDFLQHKEGGAAAERFDQETLSPLERRLFAAEREFLEAPAATARGVLLKIELLMELAREWALEPSQLRGVHEDLERFVRNAEGSL